MPPQLRRVRNTPGATLILRQLSSGHDTSFGNVSEFAWQDLPWRGTLLAMTINSEDKTGNGLQLFNSETRPSGFSTLQTQFTVAWLGARTAPTSPFSRSKSDDHREGSDASRAGVDAS